MRPKFCVKISFTYIPDEDDFITSPQDNIIMAFEGLKIRFEEDYIVMRGGGVNLIYLRHQIINIDITYCEDS